jgi:hypothetical protein
VQDTSIFLAVIEGRSVSAQVQARLLRRGDGLLDANGVLDGLDITLSVVLKARQMSTIKFLVHGDPEVITNSLHGSRGRRSDPCSL